MNGFQVREASSPQREHALQKKLFFNSLFVVGHLGLMFPIRISIHKFNGIRIHSESETLTVATVSFLTGQENAREIKVQTRS
jgi:hypothetical protein